MDCINDTDNNIAGTPGYVSVSETTLKSPSRSLPSLPSPKRSRRSMDKRVEMIPILDGSRAKGVSECTPPSDSWAWRKYGQKPIKGSPYPRGYYRCSSAKGCPARKQVERSRVDPTMLVVTYTSEHNHSYPVPKTHHSSSKHAHGHAHDAQELVKEVVSDPEPVTRNSPEPVTEPEESKFSDLIGEEYFWDVGSTSSTSPESDTMLYGPMFVGSSQLAFENEKICEFNDEEDALFAGLGELPEFSTVFRRIYTASVYQ